MQHRRTFIKQLLKTLPFAVALPEILTACDPTEPPPPPKGKNVIVIGAGVAGLAAAKKLKEKGFTVTVIEAQNKIGGRTRTDRTLGFAFDEGASWIHGPSGNPLTSLANSAGATTFLTDDNNNEVFDIDGTAYLDTFLTSSETNFNAALDAVRDGGAQNLPFETVFNDLYPNYTNNRLWKYMQSAVLEFNTGGDISNLSSIFFDDDKNFAGDDLIITNGFDKIADYLAKDLTIKLNTRVTKIDYTTVDLLRVSTNMGILEAQFVVVAVPLGVLKNNKIEFVPALDTDKNTALNAMKMGNVNKFALVFDAPFWDTNLQYIGYTPDTKGKFNYFLNMKKFAPVNALMTFAFGNYATATETMTDAQITAEIMAHLQAIYGTNIPNPTQMLRTKWGKNPNSYGAYSFAGNNTTSADFDTLSHTVLNRLFFAGEHTHRDYRGTVHGAYLSGIREADKISVLR